MIFGAQYDTKIEVMVAKKKKKKKKLDIYNRIK